MRAQPAELRQNTLVKNSLSYMQESGFKQMVKVLHERYDLPVRTYFSQKARLKLYHKCHDSIAAVIKDIQHVATATDICSSCAIEPHMN